MDQKNSFKAPSGGLKKSFSCKIEGFLHRAKPFFEKERFLQTTLPRILRAAGLGIAAYILSIAPMLFGCTPMGLSLLCAAGEEFFFIWAGCFLGALSLGKDPALFITVYTLILAFKLHLHYRYKEKHKDSPLKSIPKSLRVTSALLGALCIGLYGCIAESFSLHAFFALLFYLLSSGILTFLLSGAFFGAPYATLLFKIGQVTLASLVVFSANNLSLFGFSASLALATLFILLISRKEHPLFCALAGLFLGLAYRRTLAPSLAVVGAVAGLFGKLNQKTAPWIAVLSGFALAFYLRGQSALLYVLPDMICGLLLYIPLHRYLEKRNEALAQKTLSKQEQEKDAALGSALHTLSEKLSSLSGVLRMPDARRAEYLCQNAANEVCAHCAAGCFQSDKGQTALSNALFEMGRLLDDKPPAVVSSGCMRYKQLCDRVNSEYACYLEQISQKDAACCYAACYESIALLFEDRMQSEKQENAENPTLSARFRHALELMKIDYRQASVVGDRTPSFKAGGVDLTALTLSTAEMKSLFEKECGVALFSPGIIVTENERTLFFSRRPTLCTRHGSARIKKEGEGYCGDTILSFESHGYLYFLLCDGMGSGMDAALSSGICACFIEQLTKAGGRLETVLKTANDFLLGQKNECPTTVDLLQIDLFDGQCVFVKSGACPSIVLRAENTFKISSASMPLGATRESNCERIALRLKAGDRVIMASDGVASDIEGSLWLNALQSGRLKSDPQGLAEDILALCQKEDRSPDDRSVVVIDLLSADEHAPASSKI